MRIGPMSEIPLIELHPASPRQTAAVMFTDMVGYSARSHKDEAGTLALLDEHHALLRPIIAAFSGTEVKTIGNAFLLFFPTASQAVDCGIEMQRAIHAR